ncbi:uncharacterized protein B0H64DRAFT_212934 [Chaetomium fimeti]|uniref:Uncharacterized protein n=1 Tax=Chaetomium fimeti TaxID=1854472 RepID=A0AAE0LQE0_9PEZI|nr:hypothetical protein B0H64DRAFT_212934 [Chaetomium fimeti]
MSSSSSVQEFVVHDDSAGVELPPSSRRYRMVAAMIPLALSLLETREARSSLARVATDIIEAREGMTGVSRRRRPPHIYQGSRDNMGDWVDAFLRSLRENFPSIHISRAVEGEAETWKFDWGRDMRDYVASDAGRLYLSAAIIDNMGNAQDQSPAVARDSYDLFKFQMVISIAHEMVHLLTGFITGTREPNTPPRITAEPYNNQHDVGEAGRYWESRFLGGFVEFWSEPSNPLRARQAGVPYLFEAGPKRHAVGQRVSMSYIDDFLRGRFTFPIRASSSAPLVIRRDLERDGRCETTDLRKSRAFRDAEQVNSPPPEQSTDPARRYRAINPDPRNGYPAAGGASRRYYYS